jgi:two-component system cell cycle response regulator DivK
MKPKVLVIEDNEQNLYLITFILEKNGFAVVSARDGRQGIDKACEETPALILLDIQLPLMDGYEVARQLRQIDAVKEIPIIAVTSYAMVGDREKALAAGCTGYLEKPINPMTFIDEIRKYLPVPNAAKEGGGE